MYVCNCNGIRQSEVREVILKESVAAPQDIYQLFGCAKQCGLCVEELEMLIETANKQPCQPATAAGDGRGFYL